MPQVEEQEVVETTTSTETKPRRARRKVSPGKGKVAPTEPIDQTTKKKGRRKKAGPVASEPAEKPVKKRSKKTATSSAEPSSNGTGMPEAVPETLKFLIANPGSERTTIREATGIEKLGLPWLVSHDYVKQEVKEGKRAHEFTVTVKGKNFYKKGCK